MLYRTRSFCFSFVTVISLALALPSAAAHQVQKHQTEVSAPTDSTHALIASRLDALLTDTLLQRTQLGLMVYDLTAGRVVYTYNHRQTMRPASNQKVVTAIAALDVLGCDYKYTTGVYVTGSVEDGVLHGDICVKAAFDPLLDTDDVRQLARAFAQAGIKRVEGNLLCDKTMKDTDKYGLGWCWDDDNSVLDPALVNGCPGLAVALQKALRSEGVVLEGKVRNAALPAGARLVAVCEHGIDQILNPTMKRSDNLFAETLFYHVAAKCGKAYAGRKEAVSHIEKLIRKAGLSPERYRIADGSGLSLYNYLSPELLVSLLRYAYRHKSIYQHLLPSMPIAGVDGTLSKRMHDTSAANNVKAKTGTVTGVSTLSGYATAPNGHTLCFSIMNQGLGRSSEGRNFQDRVCVALTRP